MKTCGRDAPRSGTAPATVARVAAVDWQTVHEGLDRWGFARIPRLLGARECGQLSSLYEADDRFRKTISMDAHRFGSGEYRYLRYPLPPLVHELRRALYPPLARIANAWQARLGDPQRYESTLSRFLRGCHGRGQTRPTPLLLRYVAGGFNNLHQDLYGPVAFPLQVTVLLSRPRIDFEGGEFLLVEQRPRQQSRGCAVALERGEAIVFATRERPVEGSRGVYRAALRHGVSPIRSGRRTALGIIFHDAA